MQWKFSDPPSSEAFPSPSMRQALEALRSIPPPSVDAIRVHSQREIEALSAFCRSANEAPEYLRATRALGIPVHIDRTTPPLTIRAMLRGEIVADHMVDELDMRRCAACTRGDHLHCADGDIAREQAEFDNWLTDGPPPWWGCECEC